MYDLSNKCFKTKSNQESERLLRIAVAQGYSLPKGLKALVAERLFKFTGSPYKAVSIPKNASVKNIVTYSEGFGDEDEELKEILNQSTRFCRKYGYNMLRVYANENEEEYSGSAYAKTMDGATIKSEFVLPKPRKVTMEEIEQRFGYPIEIVP